jgi:hypothetical protein
MLIALVHSVIKSLPNSLPCVEESMAGHVSVNGIYYKSGKGNKKGEHGEPR